MSFFRRNLFQILRFFLGPKKRHTLYRFVAKYSRRIYLYDDVNRYVVRLPMNIYVKWNDVNSVHEAVANELVHLHIASYKGTIALPQVPEILDVAEGCFIMTRVPGVPLGDLFSTMNIEERGQVMLQLTNFIKVLRTMPHPVDPERKYTSDTVSGPLPHMPCRDSNRVFERQFGPFPTLCGFHSYLVDVHKWRAPYYTKYATAHDLSATNTEQETDFSKRTVFSHGDLHLRNILAEKQISYTNGKPTSKVTITGVVDFECSGWYPIYWDHGKAIWPTPTFKMWMDCWDEIAENTIPPESLEKYKQDLELEREMWLYLPW